MKWRSICDTADERLFPRVKHLDLFSGIGGFALAARWVGWETVGFCEIDPYCQAVLRKNWPDVPIYDDVRELSGESVGSVDIITGGYPCQPFSLAGKRGGEADDRHLWPEFARLIRELRPRWAVGENVAGHITMGLDDVLSDLEGLGYTGEAFVIPAVAVDARHQRERTWVVAYSEAVQRRTQQRNESNRVLSSDVSDSKRIERNKRRRIAGSLEPETPDQSRRCRWIEEVESGVDRVADGVSNRVDRLRALGNAIVPQVAYEIFRAIEAVR